MKPVVAFYIACLIILYSVLTFIGYRKEKFGNANEGFLPEVVVSAAPDKTSESKILGHHFNKAISLIREKKTNDAADQIYDALMVFTIRGVSSGDLKNHQFHLIMNNLSQCYQDTKLKHPDILRMKETFESAELFVAEDLLLRSSSDLDKNDFRAAVEDVKKAEESVAIAANYSAPPEKETEEGIINGSSNFLVKVIRTWREKNAVSFWKHFWIRINDVEGHEI